MLVDRIATRLADEDILSPHVLVDLHPDLAIAEQGDERVPLPDPQAIAHLLDERRVRVPGEHLQLMHPDAPFGVDAGDSSRRRTSYPNLSFFSLSTEAGRRRIPLCPRHPDLPARAAIKAFGSDPSRPLLAKHPEDRRAAAGQYGCLRVTREQQFPDLAQYGILLFHHGSEIVLDQRQQVVPLHQLWALRVVGEREGGQPTRHSSDLAHPRCCETLV